MSFRQSLLLLLILTMACARGSEVTRGADERLGPGRWTVDGIAIGAARSEVEALLGAGEQVGFREHAPVYRFGPSKVAVTFGRESHVIRVSGNTLLRDGQPVVETGQGADAVVAALGEGYIIERFTPTTSGVFTTGSVPGGTEFYYDDGTARYQIYVNREAVIGGIHSGTMQALPRPER